MIVTISGYLTNNVLKTLNYLGDNLSTFKNTIINFSFENFEKISEKSIEFLLYQKNNKNNFPHFTDRKR